MLRFSKLFGLAASLLVAALVLVLAACGERGGNNPTPTGPTITYKITIVSGNNQTSAIGTQLANPLRVFVTDDVGVKQVAAVVKWTVTDGYADLSASSTSTDSDGYAEINATPVDYTGVVKIEAKVRYTDVSVTFTATGT